jgi:tetratricopeptide (TPR) repeat protein
MQSQSNLLESAARARCENRLEEAHRAYAEALRVCRASNDSLGLIRALKGLGQIDRDRGNVAAALANYEEAVSRARHESDPLLLAHTVRHLGDILRELARRTEAEQCYTEALELYRAHADAPPLDLANAVRGMAVLKDDLGDSDAALTLWEEAHRLYVAIGIHAGVAESKARQAAARRKQS